MADATQPKPEDVNEDVKPAVAPVDRNERIAAPSGVRAGGKPPLAPIFETPNPKPAEPVKPPPAPSEPDPTPPPEDED